MIELPLGTDAIRSIIEFRTGVANSFFQFISYMGEVEGYILIITFVYMLYDKQLAFRLSILALVSMSLNHLLKSIISIQRPFVKEGTYMENWLVSNENAQELVSENSTPSGHAMSSSTFYGYLMTMVATKQFKFALLLIIILIGISRPYLAVHYIEDILLGWFFGLLIILMVAKNISLIKAFWDRITFFRQILIIVGGSLILWVITFYLNGGNISNQPLPFVGYLGFLLGVSLGYNLENKYVDFDPKSKNIMIKLFRWIITVGLVMIPVILLDDFFEAAWSEPTYFSHIIQYFGYAISGVLGIFIAPFVLFKLGMVEVFDKK